MRLIPTNVINQAMPDLLAADAGTLAPPANANKVHLITSPFVPGPGLDFSLLTEAAFTGGAAKSAGVGAQQSFRDPITSTRIVELLEPAGGWTWICTVAPGAPETIVGIVVTDMAGATTFGGALFDNPITVGAVGDAVVVDNVQVQLPINYAG